MVNKIGKKALLPAGLSDLLFPNAEKQAKLIENLLDCFSNYGYLRVKPPLVEFEESLLSEGPGSVLKDETFRIMDPLSQKMMALRADMTAQISRIASSRISHLPRPLRISYSGDILRVRGDSFNMERQKTQVGAELIGCASEEKDAEIIILGLKALNNLNIGTITVDLNLPYLRNYFLVDVNKNDLDAINEAIDRKDENAVKSFNIPNVSLILKFMEATGDIDYCLKYLSKLDLVDVPAKARDYLLKVCNILKENIDAGNLSIDSLENRGFPYHTGLSFTLFGNNIRGELGKGGRYQTINDESATGLTIYTEKLINITSELPVKKLIYIPTFNMNIANNLIENGYKVVFGNNDFSNIMNNANEMSCDYVWNKNKIEKIKKNNYLKL